MSVGRCNGFEATTLRAGLDDNMPVLRGTARNATAGFPRSVRLLAVFAGKLKGNSGAWQLIYRIEALAVCDRIG